MSNYAFRITASYKSLRDTIKKIAEHSDVLAVYEHSESSRVHIHGYVEGLTIGTDTFKNWIKKELNIVAYPKSDWAFSTKIEKGPKKGNPVDRDSIIYYHKGKNPILFNKGLTEEFIQEQHSKSYEPTTQYVQKVQYKIVSESKEKSMKRQWDIVREIAALAKVVSDNGNYLSDEKIIDIINTYLDTNNIVCGLYKRLDYFDTVSVRLGRTRVKDDMLASLEKRKCRG